MQISISGPSINYEFQFKILEIHSTSTTTNTTNSTQNNTSNNSGANNPTPPTRNMATTTNTPASVPTAIQTIKSILVQIYDVKATLKGGGFEKANIWFRDNSVIKDLAGNPLAEGKVVGSLRSYEYVPEGKY